MAKSTRTIPWLLLSGFLLTNLCAKAEIIFPLSALALAKERAQSIGCLNNIRQIQIAVARYANDHGGQIPPNLQAATNYLGTFQGTNFTSSPAILYCPAYFRPTLITNWASVNWDAIEYEYDFEHDANDPFAVECRCRIHNNVGLASGSLHQYPGYRRTGWPAIIANPIDQHVVPGATVRFEPKLAPDAFQPLHFQWRKEHLDGFTTNITFIEVIEDPEFPEGGYWRTNLTPNFTITSFSGETNSFYQISNAQTNQSDYYTVIVSNSAGTTISQLTKLNVDPIVSFMATNDYWSALSCKNILKQIGIAAHIWASDHHEKFPTNFVEMTNSYGSPLLGWPALLYCRADTNRVSPADWPSVNYSDVSYEILSFPNPPITDADYESPFCRCKVHGFLIQLNGIVVGDLHYAPAISSQPQSLNAIQGGTALFSVSASGTQPLTYQWRKNNSAITDATNSIYSITNVQSSDVATYSVVVTNAIGPVTSADATLTILAGFTSISRSNANTMQLTFSLLPDRTNILQASPDLSTWTNVIVYPTGNGSASFAESNSSPQLFYRIVSP